ncbi:Rrf2 family transcriptional regulator [Cetobacterium sp.]|uniref:Rrf2 family transcriptional regulator n=1 Tax=Cetobacterium sp. TaxID=2071632 RepID=UPI003F2A62C5
MFSKKLEYGYIILNNLKNVDKEHSKFGKEVLENTGIPFSLGLSILTELSNAGLIVSSKGKKGGFHIAKKNISLLELFLALENNLKSDSIYINLEYKDKIYSLGKLILDELGKIEV